MKILKYILLTIASLIVLGLLVALFVPKEFDSGHEIVINRPNQEVFDYIKFVKNQDNYGVWQLSDPGMTKSYEGTDGTVGFKYTWDGEKVGKGSQQIDVIVPGQRVETILNFGFGEPARSYMTTTPVGPTQTKVIWRVKGKSPYPFNLMGLFYSMDKDFKQGLEQLKVVLEN